MLCVGRTFVSEDELTHLINLKSSPTRVRPRTGIRHFIQGLKSRIENQEVLKEFMVKCNSFLRSLAELRKWLLELFNILYGRFSCIFTDSAFSEDVPARIGLLLCFLSHVALFVSPSFHTSQVYLLYFLSKDLTHLELKTSNTQKYNTDQFNVDQLLSIPPSTLLNRCLRTLLGTRLKQEIQTPRQWKKMFSTMLQWSMEIIATKCYWGQGLSGSKIKIKII